jgi:hypothetical protein
MPVAILGRRRRRRAISGIGSARSKRVWKSLPPSGVARLACEQDLVSGHDGHPREWVELARFVADADDSVFEQVGIDFEPDFCRQGPRKMATS